jgi:trans-aconitate 2-methyltransferase
MAAKDFGPIAEDYAFFLAHATEAESDLAAYARELAGFAVGRPSIRLLDFGCGTGEFTAQFLSAMHWPPETLEITLVEPVHTHRQQAAQRLSPFSTRAVASAEALVGDRPQFDLILSNHVLYYVDDLPSTLRQLHRSLVPAGKLLLAIAGWDNTLLELWTTGFALLGQPVPYHAAEDVECHLAQAAAVFRKTRADYQLRFPDNTENRLRILRFLFGEHLPAIGPQRLLGEFDRFV